MEGNGNGSRALESAPTGGAALLAMPLGRRTRELLQRYDLHAVKALGQNFLVDENLANKLAGAALELGPGKIIEVGPGLGALTVPLLAAGVRVTAYEKDKKLEAPLNELLGGYEGFELVMGDFLDVSGVTCQVSREGGGDDAQAEACGYSGGTAGGGVVAIGNLPYYITTPILEKLFGWQPRLRAIVVTMQREVAERLMAQPGTKAYGSLTVFAWYHVEKGEVVAKMGPSVFLPQPEVESWALRLTPRVGPPEGITSPEAFFAGVRAAFGQRRKVLRGALAGAAQLGLSKAEADELLGRAGIDGGRRGETLGPEEFVRLGEALGRTEGRQRLQRRDAESAENGEA